MTPVTDVILMTHLGDDGLPKMPHLPWLHLTNPGVRTFTVIGRDSGHGRKYDWKNSDQQLRRWVLDNQWITSGNGAVAVIEWDTLVAAPLPDLPDEFHLVGATVFRENVKIRGNWQPTVMRDPEWTPDRWMWWPEVPELEIEYPNVGLVSFGMMVMNRSVLGSLCNPKWDSIYAKSIQNELRFPSVISASGWRVGQIDLPGVKFHEVKADPPGIFHGVKEPVSNDSKIGHL